MEFTSITKEQKIAKMNDTKIRMEMELYDRVLEVGLDPDSFVLETCELPDDVALSFPWKRIMEIRDGMALIKTKLEQLQS